MKIDNIVVELVDVRQGEELIKAFEHLGATNTRGYQGTCQGGYYGLHKGDLRLFNNKVIVGDKKLITLEQLKAMKDKSEYPKLMWVGDTLNEIETDKRRNVKTCQRVVFSEQNGKFWSFAGSINMHNIADADIAYPWKYAQDIETPEPKKEIIDIAMNEDILKYAIIKINGKEVEYKK